MKRLAPHLHLLPCLMLLPACSSPPKPPTVDESARRPVNSAMALDLQACRNELHNTRLIVGESTRAAETSSAMLAHLAAQQQALTALRSAAAARADQPHATGAPNTVYTVRFAFGSAHVEMPPEAAAALIEQAKAAPLVVLRGRTDGVADTPAEARMARDRAAAVRDYLVAAGADPARVRTTYQPAGDHVADNDSPGGRQANRRVEIEVYRTLPVALATPTTQRP